MRSSESKTIDLIFSRFLLSRKVQTLLKQRSSVRYVPNSALALSFILVDVTIIQAVVECLGSWFRFLCTGCQIVIRRFVELHGREISSWFYIHTSRAACFALDVITRNDTSRLGIVTRPVRTKFTRQISKFCVFRYSPNGPVHQIGPIYRVVVQCQVHWLMTFRVNQQLTLATVEIAALHVNPHAFRIVDPIQLLVAVIYSDRQRLV